MSVDHPIVPRSLPGGSYRTEQISHIEQHLDWMRRCGLADSTLKARRMVLTYVAEFLGHDPAHATAHDLDRWQSNLDTIAKVRWQTAMITPYYRWLQAHGIRQDNPAALLPRPRRRARVRRPIPEDRLFTAVVEAPMPVRAYLLLAGWSGLRATEIAALRREDITPNLDGTSWVALVRGKGDHERVVPIPDWVYEDMLPHLPDSGPCFTRLYGDRTQQITRKQVSQNVGYYLRKKRKIPDTLHSLRRRVATALLHDTRDVRMVQELLGHASLSTLHFYGDVTLQDMTSAVARLPRPEFPSAEGDDDLAESA
ncbi:tyrosine-type recombinase/integrase [Pseudonocardia kongjuensis]|uniref:Tyrosine-type recombinase/integrase n=1 Tax=Pseudonocardia kongjuensis TaxID=102227 RepID=A0ABN1YBV9_9PSEU